MPVNQTNVTLDHTDKVDAANMIKGNLLILISTILFGVNLPALKFLIPGWLTGMDAAAVRIGGGAICFWIASMFVKTERIQRGDWKNILWGGFLGLFAFLFLFCVSLRYASPIDVSIIMTTPPLMVILYGAIFQGRPITFVGILGAIIALGGAAFVILTENESATVASDPIKGDLIAVASAVCYAFYLIIIEAPSKKYNSISLMRWVFLFAAIAAIPLYFALPKAGLFHHAAFKPIFWTSFIILGPTFVAYLLIPPAIRAVGSKIVSLYQYLMPVVAIIASSLMGIEQMKWDQPVAIVIIIIGMIMTEKSKPHTSKIAPPSPSSTNSTLNMKKS